MLRSADAIRAKWFTLAAALRRPELRAVVTLNPEPSAYCATQHGGFLTPV